VVRIDPRTGTAENGTLILARLPDTKPPKGNTIRPRALAVGPDGRVYVAGASASVPPVDKDVFWNEAEGPGAFFIALNPDFSRAHATKPAGGSANAIALSPQSVALVGDAKANIKPVHAIQEAPSGEADGWIVVLPALGR
jgi:sugar lactone lactonase YvrE